MKDEPVEFTGTIIHKTYDAVLIEFHEAEREIWIAVRVIETDDFLGIGEDITFFIPEWLAIKEELI